MNDWNERHEKQEKKNMDRESTRPAANILSESAELYNDAIGEEALARAGNNPQLKGIVHEMLFRDRLNLDPQNILDRRTAVLTKSPQAHGADVLQRTFDGKRAGQYQLKDCVSSGGIRDTLERTRSGQYRNTRLMGTEETTARYGAAAKQGDKIMHSTGISSKRTGRIADNAGVNSPAGNLLQSNVQDIAQSSANSALMGGVLSAAQTACKDIARYNRGEINAAELTGDILLETAKGGMRAGGTNAAALAL